MRQIGNIATEQDARRFADYLLTQGIESKALKENDGQWAIWVRDENKLDLGREHLAQFQSNPADPRFQKGASQAKVIRREDEDRRRRSHQNTVVMRERWSKSGFAGLPLTLTLMGLSVFVSVITDFGHATSPALAQLVYSAAELSKAEVKMEELQEIRQGQVWRLVTPIFVHLNLIHLFFNMVWLHYLGGQIERLRGSWRLGLMVLTIAVVSNFGEYWIAHHTLFGGMSGVVYGLFGYVWMKNIFDPQTGLHISEANVLIMLVWLAICHAGIVGPVANWAHLTGLGAGIVIGLASSQRFSAG